MFNNKTVTFGIEQTVQTCECDVTPNTCDYLCCCDADCPTTLTTIWINGANLCENRSKYNIKKNNL